MSPPILLFFIKMVLVALGPWCFYMNFKISFSVSERKKNVAWRFRETELNL